jgi:hypothetical protein
MKMGFQLDPIEIAEQIARDIPKQGWHLASYLDHYALPDFGTDAVALNPADRAVVVFVGSRAEAATVARAAREALDGEVSS